MVKPNIINKYLSYLMFASFTGKKSLTAFSSLLLAFILLLYFSKLFSSSLNNFVFTLSPLCDNIVASFLNDISYTKELLLSNSCLVSSSPSLYKNTNFFSSYDPRKKILLNIYIYI